MDQVLALLLQVLQIVTALMGHVQTQEHRIAALERGNVAVVSETFAAASAPALVNGCQEINGTTICSYGSAWKAASTTCVFKLPNATSTLVAAVSRTINPQGTANFGEWGYNRVGDSSTSTSLGFAPISATIQTSISASTTGSSPLNLNSVLPPNGYLVFKQGSTTPTGVTGRCSAQVMVI